MRRTRTVALGVVAVVLPVITVSAYAYAPTVLKVTSLAGECVYVSKAPGVTFEARTPGKDATWPAVAFTGRSGLLNLKADPAAVVADPASLAKAIDMRFLTQGAFVLKNAQGKVVEILDPEAMLPSGGASAVVKSAADPAGARIPTFAYAAPPTLEPKLSLMPLKATVRLMNLDVNVTPEFAKVLNDTFGAGTAKGGDAFGVCTGELTAG
ncbi:hypothetical protein [Streptomyces syringium]|uniref:hypothetical protein n=1 Tax=Streptomyces syringium TaxID=76729 RepID=UPI003404797C